MICAGGSPRNWMMYSPRSVSTTRNPASSSAWFNPISSLTMVLDLAINLHWEAVAISCTIRTASCASAAKWTLIPFDSIRCVNSSRYWSRFAITSCRTFFACWRYSVRSPDNETNAASRASIRRSAFASRAICKSWSAMDLRINLWKVSVM